jgi:RNase P subunit RPR2
METAGTLLETALASSQTLDEQPGPTMLDESTVERVLVAHQISTSASVPKPSHLTANRLRFRGTKTLTGVTSEGNVAAPDAVEHVPFEFDWSLSSGLNGVGSDKNLRGKSSVLRIIMWALRGRCDLQPEVRRWVDHVQFEFSVDSDDYSVDFDVDHDNHDYPHGVLTRERNGVITTVGSFARPEEFEEVMGVTMMSALGLPAIASQAEGQRVQHVWPTYAGALIIRGDTLDNLLGDVSFAGLPSRLLSMFVGTEWAAARAEATTATTIAKTKLQGLDKSAQEHADAMSEAHQGALKAVDEVQKKIDLLSIDGLDAEKLDEALREIPALDAEAARLSKVLRDAQNELADSEANLKAEQARRHQELEDAVAVRFFQNLKPTVCPRCSAPVTADRIDAESTGDACSVCTTHLDMDAHGHDLVLSSTASEDDRHRFEHSAVISATVQGASSAGEAEDDIDDVVDDLIALAQAATDSRARLNAANQQLNTAEERRAQFAQLLDANRDAVSNARKLQDLQVRHARAEGAAEALAPQDGPVGPDRASLEALRFELAILQAAEKVTTEWVRDGQRDRLRDLSDSVVKLAREFGMPHLTSVDLSGGATMKVTKGGSTGPYSGTERGEKLRLKLATAIALIQQGRTTGIGRHPGMLFVDSPGSEEVNDDDFDTMLEALHREASAAGIQVFVGTCHTDQLVSLLGEERCRIGRGNNFVW